MLRKVTHTIIDDIGAVLGGLVYRKNQLFNESLDAMKLGEAIRDTKLSVNGFDSNDWVTATSKNPMGEYQSSYLVHQWKGFDYPTLLFVHGSGEQPYDFRKNASNTFNKIFTDDFSLEANLILLMAPFHESSQNDYIKALGRMDNYVGMLATTTALIDALALALSENKNPKILAIGISLGGWVVNLHRAYFNRHIDHYIPMIAAARLDQVFTTSIYRKIVAENALENSELLKDLLDFEEDFISATGDNCTPLLARYDRLVEYEVQKSAYERMPLTVIDKGHFLGMTAIGSFRKQIQEAMNSFSPQ